MRRIHIALLIFLLPVDVAAHGGGLDKRGCHVNRKTGDYHCHGGRLPAKRNHSVPPSRPASFKPAYRPGAFANCAEARAAGAAPVRRGEPGYGPHLDRDNDGIGCEPYKRRR